MTKLKPVLNVKMSNPYETPVVPSYKVHDLEKKTKGEYYISSRNSKNELAYDYRPTNGYLLGLFGIERETWNITHLPTGLILSRDCYRLKDGVNLVKKLHDTFTVEELKDLPDDKDITIKVRNVVLSK